MATGSSVDSPDAGVRLSTVRSILTRQIELCHLSKGAISSFSSAQSIYTLIRQVTLGRSAPSPNSSVRKAHSLVLFICFLVMFPHFSLFLRQCLRPGCQCKSALD